MVATAGGPVNLDGGLPNSIEQGLTIGNDVSVAFVRNGVVQRFTGAGVVFAGSSQNSQISGFVINANGDGIRAGGTDGAVTGLRLTNSSIVGNDGNGLTIVGASSSDNAIVSNSIYNNRGGGIALLDGANGGQPAPYDIVAHPTGSGSTRIIGKVDAVGGYTGDFELQVFVSPVSEGGAQGRQLLGTTTSPAGAFTFEYSGLVAQGQYITVTATPVTGERNTSEFSVPVG
jgi:hypothetical protein